MARTPRANVSLTSGQGVSRLGYKKAYALGGGPPPIKGPGTSAGGSYPSSSGSSASMKQQSSGIHVDYGATIDPGVAPNAVAASPIGPAPPRSSVSLAPASGKPLFAKQMPGQRLKRG